MDEIGRYAKDSFSDNVVFTVRRPKEDTNPDTTFSQEAMQALMESMYQFVLGRLSHRFDTVGAPKVMHVHIAIAWGEHKDR